MEKSKNDLMKKSKILFAAVFLFETLLFVFPLNRCADGNYISSVKILVNFSNTDFFVSNFLRAEAKAFFIITHSMFFLLAACMIILFFIRSKNAYRTFALITFISCATGFAFAFGALSDIIKIKNAVGGFACISMLICFTMILYGVWLREKIVLISDDKGDDKNVDGTFGGEA